MPRKITLNTNRGSTLMIVLISVAIVSILATLLISMSALSAKLKYWDKQLKQTMYYSEAGLDQIYANITIQVENLLDTAYNKTLTFVNSTTFSATDDVQELANKRFKEEFVAEIKKNNKFYLDVGTILDSETMIGILNSYINSDGIQYNGEGIPSVIGIGEVKATSILGDLYNYKYSIKDIIVAFTNATTNLRTYITTDIIVRVPNFDFPLLIQESVTTNIPISEYALIAQNNIRITAGTVNVIGSMYSGGAGPVDLTDMNRAYDMHNNSGISVRNASTLNITGADGNMIVTPSWIKTNNGKINISNSKIFCDSLVTIGSGTNIINIDGSSSEVFVVDDLELNADNSSVSIEGSYYGISNGAFKHNTSSSVIINGAGSTLDLSRASKVVLPGLSYFDLNPDNAIENIGLDKKDESGNYIRFYSTGESISMRGNHGAYFMPEEYSIDPLVTKGYDDFFSEKLGIIIAPEYYTGESIVMLNIPKDRRAEYFYKYITNMTTNGNIYRLNEVKFTGFGTNDDEKMSIKLNKNSLITQGAVIATQLTNSDSSITQNAIVEKYGSAYNFTGPEAIARINRYNWAVRTGKLLSFTEAISPPPLPTVSLISRYISDGTIALWNEGFNKVSDQCVSFVSDETITISTTSIRSSLGTSKDYRSKGIIISSKDIIIQAGVNFEGIIIAGGSIEIQGNATITASAKAVSDTFASNWKLKQTIFNDVSTNLDPQTEYIGSTQTNIKGRYGELIYFENWTKNKE